MRANAGATSPERRRRRRSRSEVSVERRSDVKCVEALCEQVQLFHRIPTVYKQRQCINSV